MQQGNIFRWRGSWYIKHYFTDTSGDQPVRRRTTKKLAPVNDQYRSKKDVRILAETLLAPLNEGGRPDSGMTFSEFVEKRFLPHIAEKKKPSTHKFYREGYQNHLKARVGNIRMRDFTTRNAQELLDGLDSKLSHQSLLRIKTVMSAVFTYARQRDVIRHANPVQGSKAEGRRTKPDIYDYTLEEIQHMLTVLPEPARTAVATAAFTGLREGELRGLKREDYTGEELYVRRSIWRTHVGDTKNEESEGAVPVIPLLQNILAEHLDRAHLHAQKRDYLFAGDKRGFSLNLDNVSRRVIIPILGDKWHGWHAFRRGLGTNLSELGVDDNVTQTILRHASVLTTRKHYIIVKSERAKKAMKEFAEEITRREKGTNGVQPEVAKAANT